eukprot:jgi/Ulvmu1/10847/UM007_0021.1
MQLTSDKLVRWNMGVGIFQCVCAAILFGITDYDLTTPWYSFFIGSRDPEDADNYIPQPKRHVDVPVGVFSAIFLLLSGLDHLAVILPGLKSKYLEDIQQNRNRFRWIEYSVSASLMRVQIAMLSGAVHIHELFAIFGLTACTMLFGWLMETLNGDRLPIYSENLPIEANDGIKTPPQSNTADSSVQSRKAIDWTPFLMGCVSHLFAWSLVLCHFFQVVSNGDPPAFVWAIIFILFFLDAAFAVVQFLQFKRVLKGFARAEFAYIVLSLTSKQLLAWIEFGGTQSLNQ